MKPGQPLTRWLYGLVVPAFLGVVAGSLWLTFEPAPKPAPPERKGPPTARSPEDERRGVQLAAAAGNPAEARKRLDALIADGAPLKEQAAWLGPIAIGDSGSLEIHLKRASDGGRDPSDYDTFLQATERCIVALKPSALWDMALYSPSPRDFIMRKDHYRRPRGKPADPEPVFDRFDVPSLGFFDADISNYYESRGSITLVDCRRILKEWQAGRWSDAGEAPWCVIKAWARLKKDDPADLAALELIDSPALQDLEARRAASQAFAEQLDALVKKDGEPYTTELAQLDAENLKEVFSRRAQAGKPIALETLTSLPPELRAAVDPPSQVHRIASTLPGNKAVELFSGIPQLDVPVEFKDELLRHAVSIEFQELGDFKNAATLAAAFSQPLERDGYLREIYRMEAGLDPEAAAERVKSLPDGVEKRALLETLETAQP